MAKNKVDTANLAVGYWGRNPATHIAALQQPQKVIALNLDKIMAMGLPYNVWARLNAASEPRSIQCTCWRDTTQQSDTQCTQCYGMRWQPGFLKFGFRTTFYSAAHQDLTLTNLVQITDKTPYRFQIAPGALSGNWVSPTYLVADINVGRWDFHLDAPLRFPTNTVLTEFSIDNGSSYQVIANLPTVNPQFGGTIRFRVTLSRVAATDKSPLFEILRARFPVVPSFRKTDANPGEILLLKTWDTDKFLRESSGKSVESQGEKYWTMPLNYFDQRIAAESQDTVLNADHFLEEARGPETGVRYVSTQHAYSRTFKMFTRQEFMMRRLKGEAVDKTIGEALSRVW